MNGFKHTKGPWRIVDDDITFVAEDTKNNRIGCMFHDRSDGGEETQKANARLIAAAPDMLDALIGQYRIADTLPYNAVTRKRLRPIIERATGLTIDEAIKAWEAER